MVGATNYSVTAHQGPTYLNELKRRLNKGTTHYSATVIDMSSYLKILCDLEVHTIYINSATSIQFEGLGFEIHFTSASPVALTSIPLASNI